MRVIGGIARGRKLKSPKGLNTRPTADRVKESMFNIIQGSLIESDVLDIFAGTGALGIEAISRGAHFACFIENDFDAQHIILENLTNLGFQDKAMVIRKDVFPGLKMLSKKLKKFDVVFMDPPYDLNIIIPTLQNLIELNLVRRGGLVVIEHSSSNILPHNVGPMEKLKEKEYGATMLTFYLNEEDVKNGHSNLPG